MPLEMRVYVKGKGPVIELPPKEVGESGSQCLQTLLAGVFGSGCSDKGHMGKWGSFGYSSIACDVKCM